MKTRLPLLLITVLFLWPFAHGASGAIIPTEIHGFVNYDNVNGYDSQSALVQLSNGYLYGTTSGGGANNEGTTFIVSTNGAFETLVSFNLYNGGFIGASYIAGPIGGSDGNLYGTTLNGGADLYGEVYQETGSGINVLYSFTDGNDGAQPYAGLVQGTDGKFYGTTTVAGLFGYGTVFQITSAGSLNTLHWFTGNDGSNPRGNLVQGKDSNLYGTTEQGGIYGNGTVFKITTSGTFTTLYSFTGGADGAYPFAGLVQGQDGNFYGTTYYRGAYTYLDSTGNGYGTIFKITTNGLLTTLASFNNTNGANPYSTLVQGGDGNFYGTTYNGLTDYPLGGAPFWIQNFGTVFEMTSAGAITNLVSFDYEDGYGAYPNGLIQAKDGNFYGTAQNGGTYFGASGGIIFRLNIPGAIAIAPPLFQMVRKTNNVITLTWSAVTTKTYQLQYKTNLNQLNWNNLGGIITASGSTASTTDSISADKQRFYRIMTQ